MLKKYQVISGAPFALFLYLTVTILGPVSVVQAANVTLRPGDNMQAAVDANPEGTVFNLTPGMYRMQSVKPKNNDAFLGQNGAVMNGSKAITPVRDGRHWVATGQTQGTDRGTGHCRAGYSRCDDLEDVYVNDVPFIQAESIAALGPGKFYFDYAADKIYVGEDTTGKKVETGVTQYAFSGSARGVTIQNLVIEKYANPAQFAVVGNAANAANWTIKNNTVQLNHGTGVGHASGFKILKNKILWNGQLGIGGSGGKSIVADSNEIAFNNYAHYSPGWEAGGTKFWSSDGLTVSNNCVHDNIGPGLWTDANNVNVVYENNVAFNNTQMGIFHEISRDAIIRNNKVANNGSDWYWLYGAQILSATSNNVQIYGNTVEVNTDYGHGITVLNQDRGNNNLGVPYRAVNNRIHDNEVTFRGNRSWVGKFESGQQGVGNDYAPVNAEIFANNAMDANRYHAPDLTSKHWTWSNTSYGFADFQTTVGQETNSTADTTLPAPLNLNCAYLGNVGAKVAIFGKRTQKVK